MGLFDKALRWFGLRQSAGDGFGTQDLNEMLSALAEPEKDRVDAYKVFEGYYDGDQGVKLNERTKKFLQLHNIPFSENFCEPIVDILADRMHVEAMVQAGPEDQRNSGLSDWLSELWGSDQMAVLQGTVHIQTPMKGDGFVAVDWDAELGKPVACWNDPATCTPIYDVSGRLVMLAKAWNESGVSPTNPNGRYIRRLNLYYPDRIEKWFTTSYDAKSIWSMHMDDGETAWPVDWRRANGTPLGVAVHHFRHKPIGHDFGRSCLKSAIPQQNALNKAIVDLSMVMDNQAFDQRWGTGISRESAELLKNVAGEVWTSSNSNAKFGSFDAADPSGMLAAIEAGLQRMAARNKRPLHLLLTTGKLPSGESLRTAEAPLIQDAENCQPVYGLPWANVSAQMAALEADFGSSGITFADEVLHAMWQNPATRNEQTEAETAEIRQRVGVSKRTSLEEMGYDPDKEAEQRREERREAEAEFDRGEGGGTGFPDNEGEGGGEE